LEDLPDNGSVFKVVSAQYAIQHFGQLRFDIIGTHLDRIGDELSLVGELDRITVTDVTQADLPRYLAALLAEMLIGLLRLLDFGGAPRAIPSIASPGHRTLRLFEVRHGPS